MPREEIIRRLTAATIVLAMLGALIGLLVTMRDPEITPIAITLGSLGGCLVGIVITIIIGLRRPRQ